MTDEERKKLQQLSYEMYSLQELFDKISRIASYNSTKEFLACKLAISELKKLQIKLNKIIDK